MERHVFVYADLHGVAHRVGRLWGRVRGGRQTATFEYDAAWLGHPERFALEPALKLAAGPFHTPSDTPLFGAIGDSAPDRWGRALMRRAERRRQRAESRFLALLADRLMETVRGTVLEDGVYARTIQDIAERKIDPYSAAERVLRPVEVR